MTAFDEPSAPVDLSGFTAEGFGDDFTRQLHEMRARGAVCRAVDEDGVNVTLVTGYDAARDALTDSRICNHLRRARPAFAAAGIDLTDERIVFGAAHLVHADPPDHTRLRRLVSRAFGPRTMAALAPRIEIVTADLLDRVDPDEPVEMVAQSSLLWR